MALAATLPDYSVLDPHVHVWKHDAAFPFAPGAKVPDYDATPEMLIDLMKANGVKKTVIIQVIHYRYDNSYLAAVLKQYPQYFRGVCRVDPTDPAAPDHLSRISEQQGFQGVRLSPSGDAHGDWIRGPLMPPLWQRCQSLKVPMTLLAPISRLPGYSGPSRKVPGLDGGDRPHGGLSRESSGGTGQTHCAREVSQGFREDFTYLVALEQSLTPGSTHSVW